MCALSTISEVSIPRTATCHIDMLYVGLNGLKDPLSVKVLASHGETNCIDERNRHDLDELAWADLMKSPYMTKLS